MNNDVLIRVQNVELFLHGTLDKSIRDKIQETLSYSVPNFRFTKKYKHDEQKARLGLMDHDPWDGTVTIAKRYYQDNGILRAPTGLLSFIREIFEENSVPYKIRDERTCLIKSEGYSTSDLILRDYQEEAVKKGLERGRGILKASTGSGKTEIVTSMIVRASVFPAVYYVTSCDLLEQAKDRLEKYIRFNGEPIEIGRVGNGHCDIRPITIATIQSTWRALFPGKKIEHNEFDDYKPDDKTEFNELQRQQLKTLAKEAQFLYIDESHHVSASTLQDVINVSHNARMRFGGSASPWRDDGLDILIEACFGRRFCDISASFLINSGYLVKPQITFNHFKQELGYASDFATLYNDYVVENEERNKWIAERARLHVSHGRPTIILVKLVKHAKILNELIPEAEVLTSSGDVKKSPKKRKVVLDKMRNREVMCIIGTTLLDEGVDVPSAGAGIFAGGGKSSTRELQRVGRFMRKDPADPDKQTAYIEEFFDHTRWLSLHARARREILETEREFTIDDHRVI